MLINPALVSHVSWWFMWPKKVLWLSPTKLLISGSFTYLQIQWLYQWESLRSHSWLTHTPSVVLTPSHPFFPFPDQSTSLCLGVHELSTHCARMPTHSSPNLQPGVKHMMKPPGLFCLSGHQPPCPRMPPLAPTPSPNHPESPHPQNTKTLAEGVATEAWKITFKDLELCGLIFRII